MPLIWCSISGHGYGHAAQVVPVLNELGRLVPGLKAILRTTVPPHFFDGRLDVEWELSQAQQDVGCVQRGPLIIDVEATWAEHRRFHENWKERVSAEGHAIQLRMPDLVLSNISPLGIEAGILAQVPTVGLCSLSWDHILTPLLQPSHNDQIEIIEQIRQAYSKTDVMLRPMPGTPMPSFKKIEDIGPIVRPFNQARAKLSEAIGATADEQIVAIGFGGVSLETIPAAQLERMAGYQFITSGPVSSPSKRIRSLSSLFFSFGSLLASADILVTKPGYNTFVEAVSLNKPVVYVRRPNFADEPSLLPYLLRHGRGIELSAEDFAAGRWLKALETVRSLPRPIEAAPPPTGVAEAARILANYLIRREARG